MKKMLIAGSLMLFAIASFGVSQDLFQITDGKLVAFCGESFGDKGGKAQDSKFVEINGFSKHGRLLLILEYEKTSQMLARTYFSEWVGMPDFDGSEKYASNVFNVINGILRKSGVSAEPTIEQDGDTRTAIWNIADDGILFLFEVNKVDGWMFYVGAQVDLSKRYFTLAVAKDVPPVEKKRSTCAICEGSGKRWHNDAKCESCNGRGKDYITRSCRECRGSGMIECTNSDAFYCQNPMYGMFYGKHMQICKYCRNPYSGCYQCANMGSSGPCAKCMGKGSILCEECYGSGKDDIVKECEFCGGRGKKRALITCVFCKGKGWVEDK